MASTQALDLVWWITVVELPALCGLFWLIWRAREEADAQVARLREFCEAAQAQMRESLADYKLEVAKSYVSTGYLKDVERRLTEHLLRIDAKLEAANLFQGVPAGGGQR